MKKKYLFIEHIMLIILLYLLYNKITGYYETYAKFSMNSTIQKYSLYSLFNISIGLEISALLLYIFNKKTMMFFAILIVFFVNTVFLIDYYLDNGSNACSCILLFKEFNLIWNLIVYLLIDIILIILILKKK